MKERSKMIMETFAYDGLCDLQRISVRICVICREFRDVSTKKYQAQLYDYRMPFEPLLSSAEIGVSAR